jgi:hypothetical protein
MRPCVVRTGSFIHCQLVSFEVHYIVQSFGVIIIHANHFHPKFRVDPGAGCIISGYLALGSLLRAFMVVWLESPLLPSVSASTVRSNQNLRTVQLSMKSQSKSTPMPGLAGGWA